MWSFGPARQCGAIYQSRLVVSTKKRWLSAHIELDVAQNGVLRARDLVFHERAAPGAGELAEHRPVVYVAAVVADVGIRRAHVRFAPHAMVLVVVAHGPQVRGALRASRVQAAAVAAHLEILCNARDYFPVELLHRR